VAERHSERRERRVKESPIKGEPRAMVVNSTVTLTSGSEQTKYSPEGPCESSWLRWLA
jgi:hypothetical protein